MIFSAGDLVVSLCGRDAGDLMIVTGVYEGCVTVADGRRRKADKKKKKNIRHVRATGLHSDLINNVTDFAIDANIRREIKRLEKLI